MRSEMFPDKKITKGLDLKREKKMESMRGGNVFAFSLVGLWACGVKMACYLRWFRTWREHKL